MAQSFTRTTAPEDPALIATTTLCLGDVTHDLPVKIAMNLLITTEKRNIITCTVSSDEQIKTQLGRLLGVSIFLSLFSHENYKERLQIMFQIEQQQICTRFSTLEHTQRKPTQSPALHLPSYCKPPPSKGRQIPIKNGLLCYRVYACPHPAQFWHENGLSEAVPTLSALLLI